MIWKPTWHQLTDPASCKLAEWQYMPHVFYFSITFHSFIFSTATVLLIYERGDWMLRLMTSEERSIPLRSVPWNSTRLPPAFRQSLWSVWVIRGLNKWGGGPWGVGDQCKCKGKVIFVKSWISIFLFQSLIHSSFLPLPLLPVPHLLSLCPNSPLSLHWLKSSIIFRLPGKALRGHRGPFGLSTLKNSWFETTTAAHDDSMIWLFSAWSSFLLPPFSSRLALIPPDDWHWSILESFSSRTPIP